VGSQRAIGALAPVAMMRSALTQHGADRHLPRRLGGTRLLERQTHEVDIPAAPAAHLRACTHRSIMRAAVLP